MTITNMDLTDLDLVGANNDERPTVESAFPAILTGDGSYSLGTALGTDPKGNADWSGVSGGDKALLRASGLSLPDTGYRIGMVTKCYANNGYRRSHAVLARTQVNGSAYGVLRDTNTNGFRPFRAGGGRYSAITYAPVTEATALGSVSSNFEAGITLGIGVENLDANTVRVNVFDSMDPATPKLFHWDDADANQIRTEGDAAWLCLGNSPALQMQNWIVDDGAVANNFGLRISPRSNAAGTTAYQNLAGITTLVWESANGALLEGSPLLGSVTSDLVNGVLPVDDDMFIALGGTAEVLAVHLNPSGGVIGANFYDVVDLNNANLFSDSGN